MAKCPKCGTSLYVILKVGDSKDGGGGGGSKSSPSQQELDATPNPTDAEMEEFIRAVDNAAAHLELTKFEVDFIKGKFEAAEKYKGKMKFFGGQVDVMKKMIAKYSDKVKFKGASNANDPPPRQAPAKESPPPDDKSYIPF